MTPPGIVGAGCVFPSGPGIGLADVALRTGLALVRRHPFFVDRCGQRVQASYFVDPSLRFDASRWPAMAEACLVDLLAQMGHPAPVWMAQSPWRAWVVLPGAARSADAAGLYDRIEPVLAQWPYPLQGVELHVGDHAAGVQAMASATAACDADPDLMALVLAVDSQVVADALTALEHRSLLHGARHPYEGAARANPYGRIPGEGAAALLLSGRQKDSAWCTLAGVALATEPRCFDQPEPCTGQGLTDAARRAMAAADGLPAAGGRGDGRGDGGGGGNRNAPPGHAPRVACTLTHDATGEPYRADEFGFTALRLARRLSPDYRRITPALVSADLGAASAIAHAALTAWHCRHHPDGTDHLILSSSDDALRGAMVLRAPDQRDVR